MERGGVRSRNRQVARSAGVRRFPLMGTRPDMRSVRESCHLPSQSRRCVRAVRAHAHANAESATMAFLLLKTESAAGFLRRMGHRYSASKSVYSCPERPRRIAGAVAGIATALTFLANLHRSPEAFLPFAFQTPLGARDRAHSQRWRRQHTCCDVATPARASGSCGRRSRSIRYIVGRHNETGITG